MKTLKKYYSYKKSYKQSLIGIGDNMSKSMI